LGAQIAHSKISKLIKLFSFLETIVTKEKGEG
jgi:hypothetical protein